MRTFTRIALAVALVVGLALPVGASARPPEPAPVEEAIGTPPSPGYVWVPGHWDWRSGERRYQWVSGYWAPARETVVAPGVVVGPRFVVGPRYYFWHPWRPYRWRR